MPEIHRIASEAIWTLRDDPLWRNIHSCAAAGARQPIAADAQILQVSPDKQRYTPGYERQSTSMECKLEDDHDQRA